ncbi:hypothetical protein JVT61DRAFT_7178 [Boletus reticuloceps]|uniref:Uncharacterized protein n=1 Tax=Boletus reticuloceps TaxID=495285 RepID=A0A8I2YJ06_9AGAM|nr:hypothetical protein JVT61DRAFT_7178 [Boletus reticuloceps]
MNDALLEQQEVACLARLTDQEIIAELQKEINLDEYGIGLTSFKKIRKTLDLERTRKQAHTPDSIRVPMTELRSMYPDAGVREMTSLLFHEYSILASRTYEPHLVRQRKVNRLK